MYRRTLARRSTLLAMYRAPPLPSRGRTSDLSIVPPSVHRDQMRTRFNNIELVRHRRLSPGRIRAGGEIPETRAVA